MRESTVQAGCDHDIVFHCISVCLSKMTAEACLLGTFLFEGVTGCGKLATFFVFSLSHAQDRPVVYRTLGLGLRMFVHSHFEPLPSSTTTARIHRLF